MLFAVAGRWWRLSNQLHKKYSDCNPGSVTQLLEAKNTIEHKS
jgi:hypothetical protein